MATEASNTTPSSATYERPCCSEKTFAYLLLRLLLGLMLLLAGVEKFKSPDSPYSYSTLNWHNEKDASGEVVKLGRWLSVAKPVYEFAGFNNAAVFQVQNETLKKYVWSGEKISNFISQVFYYFAQTLPYTMILSGLMILLGLFNRIGLFLGGAIWISLAAGQMTLPDNPTVFMLSQYTLMYAVAIALVRYNRFAITRF